MWHYDDGWGSWLAMSIGMLAFWALLAVIVVAVIRSLRDDRGRRGDDALRVLDDRFARGDIDEQEYRTRRDLLSAGR